MTIDMEQPTPSLRDSGNICSPENMANGKILIPFKNYPPSKITVVLQLELTKVHVKVP